MAIDTALETQRKGESMDTELRLALLATTGALAMIIAFSFVAVFI
ncbi:MAG: YnhF family membrane protein [Plesiomonas sp.]